MQREPRLVGGPMPTVCRCGANIRNYLYLNMLRHIFVVSMGTHDAMLSGASGVDSPHLTFCQDEPSRASRGGRLPRPWLKRLRSEAIETEARRSGYDNFPPEACLLCTPSDEETSLDAAQRETQWPPSGYF